MREIITNFKQKGYTALQHYLYDHTGNAYPRQEVNHIIC